MNNEIFGVAAVVAGPLLFLSAVLAPRVWADKNSNVMATWSQIASIVAFATALIAAIAVALGGRIEAHLFGIGSFKIGIYFDALSATMLLLVSFLAWIVTRYARTYLDGDKGRGHFLKWLCVTIGAVLTLLVAGNILMFTLAWMATSLSLHQLLTFYSDRPGAVIAARKKFIISRMGDACLIAVIFLSYRVFGSWDFSDWFTQAAYMRETSIGSNANLSAIALLLVVGAMLKSAQFPFHSWLPDTMETPTPVSALMHAGIINAGGFLVVRLSPVISFSPFALELLAVVGAFTAVFASLVMMTQASIKRQLAFSTIAQMGFMMLQCGLGAFSIAVLHLVAHSLYKAHAFLSSGGVVALSKSSWTPTQKPLAHPAALVLSLLAALGISLGVGVLFGANASEPGALLLGAVFVMAMVHLLWSLWGITLSARSIGVGALLVAAVSAGYFALHLGFKTLLGNSIVHPEIEPLAWPLGAVIALLFIAVLVLQEQIATAMAHPKMRALYVHARNGFYFNTLANRAVQKLWPVR